MYTRSWAALRGWDPPPYDRSNVFSNPWIQKLDPDPTPSWFGHVMIPEPLEEFHLVSAQFVRGEEGALVHAQTEQAPTLRIRQHVLLSL